MTDEQLLDALAKEVSSYDAPKQPSTQHGKEF